MTKSKSMSNIESQLNQKVKTEFEDDLKVQIQKKDRLMKLNYQKKFTMEKENLEKLYDQRINTEL